MVITCHKVPTTVVCKGEPQIDQGFGLQSLGYASMLAFCVDVQKQMVLCSDYVKQIFETYSINWRCLTLHPKEPTGHPTGIINLWVLADGFVATASKLAIRKVLDVLLSFAHTKTVGDNITTELFDSLDFGNCDSFSIWREGLLF